MCRKSTSCLVGVLGVLAVLVQSQAAGVKLGDRGFMEINGVPFIPVGVYDVNSLDDTLAVGRSGLAIAESMLPGIFEWAAEAGLYSLHWMIARLKSPEEIAEIVERHRSDPFNIAWYTYDEPNEVGVPPEECEETYRLIKSLDPDRPVVLTVSPAYWYHPWSYSEYSVACDIIATDPYPIEIGHGMGIEYVGECVRRARADSRKPVWAVLQAFPWPQKRLPSREELRCMTYQSLIHGASGILYYTYQVPSWDYTLVDTPLWDEILELTREVAQLGHIFASPAEMLVVGSIHTSQHQLGGLTYLVAVNVMDREVDFEWEAPRSAGSANVLFEGREVELVDGMLRDRFGPLETHVYAVSEALPGLLAALGFGMHMRTRRRASHRGL